MPGYDGRQAITTEARPGGAKQVRLVRGPHFQHDPEERRRPDLNAVAGSVNHSPTIFVRETASVNDTFDEATSIATHGRDRLGVRLK